MMGHEKQLKGWSKLTIRSNHKPAIQGSGKKKDLRLKVFGFKLQVFLFFVLSD
jgi:hypothetical protein